jgi:hypothetical protein
VQAFGESKADGGETQAVTLDKGLSVVSSIDTEINVKGIAVHLSSPPMAPGDDFHQEPIF